MKKPQRQEALLSLFGTGTGTGFTQEDGLITAWDSDNPQPTEEEVELEITRLVAEYDAQEYARNRAASFPNLGDQLDMQYWDQVNSTTTWKDAIAKVKSDNPKE